MAIKSVLIIGGSGFVGTHLALRLREGYKVFATYNRHRIVIPGVTTIPMGVQSRDWVKRVTYLARPDAVIYAAGTNGLEWAEKNSKEAEFIHGGGAVTVASAADMMQPKFIYLSNCYVFDGVRGSFRENDILLPTTSLGKAKISGENFIRSRSLNYVIVRSSGLLGRGNGLNLSLFDQIRTRLGRNERVEIPHEELHNFTHIDPLVELVEKLIESGIRKGTFHLGGLTKTTHFDLALALAKRFGYDSKLIIPTKLRKSSDDTDSLTESRESTFLDFSLNCTQAVESLKIKPLLLEESLDLIKKQLIPSL